MTGPTSQCSTCRHFRSPFSREDGDFSGGPTCTAFPDAIPDEIWWNRLDHREPVPGDGGVTWDSDGQEFPEWALTGG